MKTLVRFFFLTVFAFTIFSCKSDDDTIYVDPNSYHDNDTYPRIYDLVNANFQWDNGSYVIYRQFSNAMLSTDVMLVYLKNGQLSDGTPIWQMIPTTLYLNNGLEVDYNFDFTMYDVYIYAGGNFDLNGSPYISNQTFRIVFVPAIPFKGNQSVDYKNYQEVVKRFGIDDSQPILLK